MLSPAPTLAAGWLLARWNDCGAWRTAFDVDELIEFWTLLVKIERCSPVSVALLRWVSRCC